MKREKKKRKYNCYCLGFMGGMVWGGGGGLYKGIKWRL